MEIIISLAQNNVHVLSIAGYFVLDEICSHNFSRKIITKPHTNYVISVELLNVENILFKPV